MIIMINASYDLMHLEIYTNLHFEHHILLMSVPSSHQFFLGHFRNLSFQGCSTSSDVRLGSVDSGHASWLLEMGVDPDIGSLGPLENHQL